MAKQGIARIPIKAGNDAVAAPARTTLYALLAEEIREQIRKGVFLPGHKLPSVRELSQRRKVSINTVQEAYRQLEDGRWIVVRSQSGAYVAAGMPDQVADGGATAE